MSGLDVKDLDPTTMPSRLRDEYARGALMTKFAVAGLVGEVVALVLLFVADQRNDFVMSAQQGMAVVYFSYTTSIIAIIMAIMSNSRMKVPIAVFGLMGLTVIWLWIERHSCTYIKMVQMQALKPLGTAIIEKDREIARGLPDPSSPNFSWEELLPAPFNQGNCGSCWAVSGSAAMSTRLLIDDLNAGKPVPAREADSSACASMYASRWRVSPQYILDASSEKCNGANVDTAMRYANQAPHGAPSAKCVPMALVDESECASTCIFADSDSCAMKDVTKPDCEAQGGKAKASWDGLPGRLPPSYRLSGEQDMKKAIAKHGPIVCGINFYTIKDPKTGKSRGPGWTLTDSIVNGSASTLITSSNFIARPAMDGSSYTTEFKEGGHAIVIYGWGEHNGVKYWNMLNSWGSSWAFKGTTRIERGYAGEGGAWNVEKDCAAVGPDLLSQQTLSTFGDAAADAKLAEIDDSRHQGDLRTRPLGGVRV